MIQTEKDNGTLQSYTVRDGTIDYGKDYEVKMCALFSLKCAGNKNVENTSILVNADKCGAFDDVVFSIETKDGQTLIYLIQLKHGMDSKNIPAREFKTKTDGSYYLEKYYKTILEIKTSIDNEEEKDSEIINYLRIHQDKMVFILFTNRGTTDCDFLLKINKKSIPETKWFLYQYIDTGGNISQLDCNKLSLKNTERIQNLIEDRFFIFTKQIHIEKIDSVIENAIENLIKPLKLSKKVLMEIIEKFTLFVTDWCRGELGGHYPLTKDLIFRILFENLIRPYMVNFEEAKIIEGFDLNIWFEIIQDKSVILISEDEIVLEFLERFIYNKIKEYCEDPKNINLWKRHPGEIRKKILRFVSRSKQIRICDAFECLWKSGQVPLVLRADTLEDFKNILDLKKNFKHEFNIIVLTKNAEMLSDVKFPNSLFNFQDLNPDLQGKILNLPVKLQKRSSIKLIDFLDDQIFFLLTIKDIIYILTNNFSIGNEYQGLSEMFIERSLGKVWIEPEVFQKVPEEIFLVKCKSLKDFQLFLIQNLVIINFSLIVSWGNKINDEVRIIIFEDGCSLKQMEIFGMTRNKNTHLLVIQENNIEWIKSFGSIKKISEFRAASENQGYSNINQIIKDIPNRVNLISASPGMGKSILLDYISLNVSTDWWVLKINLLDYVDYYKTSFVNDSTKHLDYIAERILDKKDELGRIIFKKYLFSNKVLVILDAFDEVPLNSQNKAKEMIKKICDSNHCTFLTTRPVYQTQLEELLNTFSVNIRMFTKYDQKNYLINHFSKNNPQTHHAILFSDLLLNAAKKNLNDQDFTGVPLQTKLLGEVFTEDYEIFQKTGFFENKHFDLLYLYQYFIDQKIRISCEKFGNSSEDMLVQYRSYRTLYALRVLFAKEDLEELKIEEKLEQVLKLFPNTLQLIHKDGIVVVEKEKVTFVHRTFAEYLSAEWLAENINSEYKIIAKNLIQKIFAPAFSVVHNIFDRILAKDRPLLLAIIGHRKGEAKTILNSNPDALEELDQSGRNFLHLIASWGVHHPPDLKSEVKTLKKLITKDSVYKILHFIPSLESANTKDDLLGYTPLDYAVMTGSLHIADYICSRTTYSTAESFYKNDNLEYIFDYIVKMTYFSLMPIIERDAALRHLRYVFYLQGTIVQQIGTSYLRRIAVTGNIRDMAFLINNERNINEVDGIGCTILHAAVMYGRVIMTNLLLEKGADVNIKDNNGYTALHWATIKGFGNIANVLVLKDADVNATSDNGRTALHLAVFVAEDKNRNEIVTILLENKASILQRDNDDKTPLHYCVEFKQMEILKLLLQAEECSSSTLSEIFTFKDGSRICLLYNIARTGFAEALKLFLNHNPDLEIKEIHDTTVLQVAATEGQTNIINLLFSSEVTKPPNIEARNSSNLTALHLAACNGHTDTVKLLLTLGAELEPKDEFNRTPLIYAVQNGHEDTTNILLEQGANLEAKGERDQTSLIVAARNGHIDLVRLLWEKGANIEATNNETMTALHFASWAGQEEIIKFLLAKGAKFDNPDIYGRTPLICAIAGGLKTIDMFLEKDLNLEIKDGKGMSALAWASWFGHKETVELLLEKGANLEVRDNRTNTPLIHAADNDQAEVVALLILKGADLEAKGQEDANALYCAAWKGGTTTVELLLQHVTNIEAVNKNGTTALMGAARNGYCDIVRLLLANHANVDAKDFESMTPLHWAAWYGHTDIIEVLLSKGADLDIKNIYERHPLLSASGHGHTNTVGLLLSKGADIETSDKEKMTALHWAALGGNDETISLLISKRANIEANDDVGSTPLQYASYDGYIKAMIELLNNGANVNAANYVGMTSLHWTGTHIQAAEILISSGANLEAKNKHCKTPLAYVAEAGKKEAVQFLLTQGADLEARDVNNRTPLHLAVIEGHAEVVEILLENGANLDAQDEFGNTSLIYSARLGLLNILRVLLGKGADISTTNNDVETALYAAVWNRQGEAMELLISQGANFEVKNKEGRTPLMAAVFIGDEDSVNFLLSKGADLETKDHTGENVFRYAVMANKLSMVELLLLKGVELKSRDNLGRTALSSAIILGYMDIINLLLLKGDDITIVDNEGMGCLHWAALNFHKNVMLQLIEGKNLESKDVFGRTPLLYAAQQGQVQSMRLLLSKGACIDVKDNEEKTALHLGAINGHIEIIELILELKAPSPTSSKDSSGHEDVVKVVPHGPNLEAVDHEKKTPLHWAASQGFTDIVELLLNHGGNSEARDVNDQTPLICAAQQGHLDTVEILISKGADLEKKDNLGMTPLFRALDNNQVAVANFLLVKGADPEAMDASKLTPLHYSVMKGLTEIVTLLLSKNVPLNLKDAHGNSPLIYAIGGAHTSIALLLLLKGADIETESCVGVTALQLATSLGDKEVVEMLLSKGAEIDRKDRQGKTALIQGARYGHTEIVRILLAQGANIEVKDNLDATALFWASSEGHQDVVSLLLEQGANVETICKDFLIVADEKGYEGVVSLLLDKGVDVKVKDKNGLTALDWAKRNGHEGIAKLIRTRQKENCVIC